MLRVERVRVAIPELPAALAGLRIALLTDIHVGHWAGVARVRRAVRLANEQEPDLAVLGGDLVNGRMALPRLARCAAAMGQLRARLGAVAVLGNHDYLAGADRVQEALVRAGVTVLRNRGMAVPVGDRVLWLAGLDDVRMGRPDPAAAFAGAPPGALRLALVHEPDYADTLARGPEPVHLQLSGHSHGGQVRLPVVGALVLPRLGRKYDMGLQRVAGSELLVYTSRGIGVTGPPFRFLCPPEVTLIELTGAEP